MERGGKQKGKESVESFKERRAGRRRKRLKSEKEREREI
jgi:hypothetical protein